MVLKLPPFEYFEPHSLEQACDLLSKYRGKAALLAGGTNLLVQMKLGRRRPQAVINLKRIPKLSYVAHSDEGLRIGALTTIREILRSTVVKEHFTALWEAAQVMAFPNIRNIATIGGNICNAAPTADLPPPLMALGARVVARSSRGLRSIALADFFQGPNKTSLSEDEVLVEVFIPNPPRNTSSTYLKLPSRTLEDISVAGVAVSLSLNGQEVKSLRLALGAVAPVPILVREAEEIAKGRRVDQQLIDEVAEEASRKVNPPKSELWDFRAPAEYRREVVKVLTKRALRKVLGSLGWSG